MFLITKSSPFVVEDCRLPRRNVHQNTWLLWWNSHSNIAVTITAVILVKRFALWVWEQGKNASFFLTHSRIQTQLTILLLDFTVKCIHNLKLPLSLSSSLSTTHSFREASLTCWSVSRGNTHTLIPSSQWSIEFTHAETVREMLDEQRQRLCRPRPVHHPCSQRLKADREGGWRLSCSVPHSKLRNLIGGGSVGVSVWVSPLALVISGSSVWPWSLDRANHLRVGVVRGLVAAGFNAGLGFAAPGWSPGPWFQTHRLLAVLKHTHTHVNSAMWGHSRTLL